MAFFAFFGSLFIACVVGYIAEKSGFTHNGYVPSIIICIGGTVAFFMLRVMFGVSFGWPGRECDCFKYWRAGDCPVALA
jgi:flagellar motor component MotA